MKNHKRTPIISLITACALVFCMCLGIMVTDGAYAQSNQPGTKSAAAEAKNTATARYAQDLTKLARRGAFDLVEGHEADAAVGPTIQILSRQKQNNPVLIAEDENASKTVVQVLARRIASGSVPVSLQHTRLYSLKVTALFE